MAIDLNDYTPQQQLAAIYILYYDRAPDPAGFQFWLSLLVDPEPDAMTLEEIATHFSDQVETRNVYDFFDPDTVNPSSLEFLSQAYANLFGRAPDAAGIKFWANQLDGGLVPTGEILLAMMEGATGSDIDVLNNKIEVALDWHDSAVDAGMIQPIAPDGPERDAAADALDGVTDNPGTVETALALTDAYFDRSIRLTSGEDRGADFIGTHMNDIFDASLTQIPGSGGVANTLSSADVLNGVGGIDTLKATLVPEFIGNAFNATIDVQPTTKSIENIEIEARDGNFTLGDYVEQHFNIDISTILDVATDLDIGFEGDYNDFWDFFDDELQDIDIDISFEDLVDLNRSDEDVAEVTLDAKNMTDIQRIGSHFSDGDLVIENLTTLDGNGYARTTDKITVVMDHTDNFNSDGDASDLTVYFDEDYLLSPDKEQSGAVLTIELMDLDAETLGQPPLLDNPFGSITFTMNGETKSLDFGTDSDTYAELLVDIQEAIDEAALTDPDFAQLSASFGPDFHVRDTDFDPDPTRPLLTGQTIVITNSGPEVLEAVTMTATGSQPAGKDFHTGFGNELPETEEFPISINVELEKVGRGGEGGDLKIGGKDQHIGQGIEVFNVTVVGDESKPSNLGQMTSTNGDLSTINIATEDKRVGSDSFASLTIRDGFGSPRDLKLVDASEFLGDLTLGNHTAVINLDTLIATGGGDVTYYGQLTGAETAQAYSVITAGGDDMVDMRLDGDALDFAGSSLNVSTGAGKDDIKLVFQADGDDTQTGDNEQLNQVILDDVSVDGGADDDHITVDGIGNANIHGGDGNDVIKTAGSAADFQDYDNLQPADTAVWAFNFDPDRADANGGIGNIALDELPGVGLDLAFLAGATITVTLSGAGIDDLADGGGVMALSNAAGDAVQGENGYEASFTIDDLINGNNFYGDQRDVNAAVIAAIEGDPVLSELLTAELGPNNTLIVRAKDSGRFAEDDLRIDIAQAGYDSDTASAILSEARSLFGDSSLTTADLFGSNSPSEGDDYEGPGGLNASAATSDSADEWYDGLSVEGDVNSTTTSAGAGESNLHTQGTPSNAETDNTINGGNDDDLIVLSTDGIGNPVPEFETNFGTNNRFLNGASNETIVSDGDHFGYDTIMNFTTAGPGEMVEFIPTWNEASVEVLEDGDEEVPTPYIPGSPESFVLRVSAADANAADPFQISFGGVFTANIAAGASLTDVTSAIATAFANSNASGYTAVDNGDGTLTFTYDNVGNQGDVVIGYFTGLTNLNGVSEIVSITDGVADTPAGFSGSDVAEVIRFTFQDADADGTYTFNGQTVSVEAGDTGDQIAQAFFDGNDFADWNPTSVSGNQVTLTATSDGTGGTPDYGDRPDVTIDQVVGTNIDGDPITVPSIHAGVDFLDFTYYLTSFEDTSTNPPGTDSSASEAPIEVTLDYNENNTLGGSGDGSVNTKVEANEVAFVRMADDTGDGETFATLSASDVATLFNKGGAYTGFGGDSSFGNLDAADFSVETYDKSGEPEELIGDGKAVFAVENGANHGEYKYFELTWSGDETSDSGDVVSVREIGGQDFGTSLTDLDDVNLVGSSEHAGLDLTDGTTWGL